MRKLVFLMVASAVALAIFVATRNQNAQSNFGTNIAPSDHPPSADFSLTDLFGQKLTLASLKGKVVLVDFWATWCDPCREEIPHFIQLQNEYGDRGLQIVGISMDDSEQPVRDFYKQFRMNYPVAMADAETPKKYGGIFGLPVAFLIGRDGRIYGKYIGETDMGVFETEIRKLL